jgi:hypothetical protein
VFVEGFMRTTFFFSVLAALTLAGCRDEGGVPGPDNRVQTERGTPGATPKRNPTHTDSYRETSVPHEGDNLDRGVSLDNDPRRNAPGAETGDGTGKETR